MLLVVLIIVLAVVLGGVGLLVKGLFWLAIVGLILFIAGCAFGTLRRR